MVFSILYSVLCICRLVCIWMFCLWVLQYGCLMFVMEWVCVISVCVFVCRVYVCCYVLSWMCRKLQCSWVVLWLLGCGVGLGFESSFLGGFFFVASFLVAQLMSVWGRMHSEWLKIDSERIRINSESSCDSKPILSRSESVLSCSESILSHDQNLNIWMLPVCFLLVVCGYWSTVVLVYSLRSVILGRLTKKLVSTSMPLHIQAVTRMDKST